MANARGPVLIPGTPTAPTFPLARYRSPGLSGVVKEFVRSATQPGDLILEVGTAGASSLTEVVDAERRIIALNRNPVELLVPRVELDPAPPAEVESALSQLGDLRKGERPLIAHIRAQYETLCPECGSLGVAEWFAWDRGAGRPFAKRVRCPRCGISQEGDVDERDLASAGSVSATSGPAYHLALSKAAGPEDPLRPRAAELIGLYTSRNLAVLMDTLNRLPQLNASPQVRRIVSGLFLEACERASSLSPYTAPEDRPKSLRSPQRFLEHNVWFALELALDHYRLSRSTETPRLPDAQMAVHSLDELLVRNGGAFLLIEGSVQDLRHRGLEGSVKGLVIEIRPPDAVFWALSVLWATWLWGDSVPAGLHSFMRRRRLDWEWYSRSLVTALHHLRPLFHREAKVLAIIPTLNTAAVRAAVDTVARSQMQLERYLVCSTVGVRLLLHHAEARPGPGLPRASAAGPETCRRILSRRGEPMARARLEAACILESQDPDLVLIDPDEPGSLVARLGAPPDSLLWLSSPKKPHPPLGDRVEAYVRRLLVAEREMGFDDLLAAVYARFSGPLSPDQPLVTACITAYSEVGPNGQVSLRAEDDPLLRRTEIAEVREQLVKLGESIGFGVSRRLNRDITWQDGDRPLYTFRCTATALLGPHLLKAPPTGSGRPCLVLPGGRAALVALKLKRDPRLRAIATQDRWTFVKFRHLRRMSVEVKQRSDIEVYLGLDPIVEQRGAQIPLPLE